ncbi:uncharacterized protein [Pleurodeles waltl]|uniref:uncharacterized protein isoform X4 n=1 Tax=Pleurodeles waltl TaxID=8319 RepID=UPI0037093E13
MLWILVLLQMISTVISGWTTTSNMLWILVLLQMISTVISGWTTTSNMLWILVLLQMISTVISGCKKTNSVEDATPKPISSYKNINNTFEHATLQPISESSSKNSNLCFLFLPIVVVPFVLWIWYKKKERCWESKKKSAKLCSGSSRSTRPDDSVSEETSTEALNIELHTFIVQVEET